MSGLKTANSNAFRLIFFALFEIFLVYKSSCKQVKNLQRCSVNARKFYRHYIAPEQCSYCQIDIPMTPKHVRPRGSTLAPL